jgi:hypothetical protein
MVFGQWTRGFPCVHFVPVFRRLSHRSICRDIATGYMRHLCDKAGFGLIRDLRTGNVAGCAEAIAGLTVQGSDVNDANPALEETTDDPDPVIREAARKLLKALEKK